MSPAEAAVKSRSERAARLTRIRRVSRLMKWFVTLFMMLLLVTLALTIAAVYSPESFDAAGEIIELGDFERRLGDIPLMQRLFAMGLLGLAFGILFVICWQIRRLFEFLRQGDFFSPRTLSCFVAIGLWLIAFGILEILIDPIASYLLTLDMPDGQRVFDISLDGGELFFGIVGGLMIVFGWTLREAAAIAEENRQFV